MATPEISPPKRRLQPLWVRVDENRVKLAVFVVSYVAGSAALLSLALVAVPGVLLGWGIGVAEIADPVTWYATLPWVVAAAFAAMLAAGGLIAAVQIANAEDWVANRFKGGPLPGEHAAFASVVEDMSLAAGLGERPKLLVLDEPGINAFALGATRKRPAIGVTKGFLAELTAEEQRAVVATLVARIVAGDIMFGTALAALMGPLKAVRESRNAVGGCASGCADTGCADGCSHADGCGDGCSGCGDILGDGDAPGGCMAAIMFAVFIAVVVAVTYVALVAAAWIVTIWGRLLQNTTYEKADAEGMLLLKDPAPMLSALKRVVASSNAVGEGDASYDGIFYAATSGKPAVDRIERRRFERLCEVVGVEGLAAELTADQ